MTIGTGSGLSAQLVVKDESTYGVAPDMTSGVTSFEFLNDTIELKKTAVDGEGLAAGHVYHRTKRRVLTNYTVDGQLSMELPTRHLGYWLRYMIGDFTETPTQVASSGIYSAVYQPKSTQFGHSFAIQKGVPASDATVMPHTYVGCKVTSWEIQCSTGAIAKLMLNIDARNELAGAGNSDPLNGSVPALSPWLLASSGLGYGVWHFRQATLLSGGTPTGTNPTTLSGATTLAQVRDATIQGGYGYDTNRVFFGANGFKGEPIENAFRTLSGSFVADFQSNEALYNAYSADTTTSLELTFQGPTVSTSSYYLDIIVPNIKLDGESPKVGGPGVVQLQCNYTGYDDETTVPIQITYRSEDTTV